MFFKKLCPFLEYKIIFDIIQKNKFKSIHNILRNYFLKEIKTKNLIGKSFELLKLMEYLVLDLNINNKIIRDDDVYKYVGDLTSNDNIVLSDKSVCSLGKTNIQLLSCNKYLRILRGNLFYAEIEILEKNHRPIKNNDCISFGFCKDICFYNKQVGWENGCIGIHTDDGGIFRGSTTPIFKVGKIDNGSIIGAGIIQRYKYYIVFFTLNGRRVWSGILNSTETIHLGLALDSSYPIKLNIGNNPFYFDLLKYYNTDLLD